MSTAGSMARAFSTATSPICCALICLAVVLKAAEDLGRMRQGRGHQSGYILRGLERGAQIHSFKFFRARWVFGSDWNPQKQPL